MVGRLQNIGVIPEAEVPVVLVENNPGELCQVLSHLTVLLHLHHQGSPLSSLVEVLFLDVGLGDGPHHGLNGDESEDESRDEDQDQGDLIIVAELGLTLTVFPSQAPALACLVPPPQ